MNSGSCFTRMGKHCEITLRFVGPSWVTKKPNYKTPRTPTPKIMSRGSCQPFALKFTQVTPPAGSSFNVFSTTFIAKNLTSPSIFVMNTAATLYEFWYKLRSLYTNFCSDGAILPTCHKSISLEEYSFGNRWADSKVKCNTLDFSG